MQQSPNCTAYALNSLRKLAYHHQNAEASTTNLHKYVRQTLDNADVASAHGS